MDKTGVVSQKKKTTKSRGSNTNCAAVCVHKPSGTIYAEIQMVRWCLSRDETCRLVYKHQQHKRGEEKEIENELMDMVLLIGRDESKRATRSNVYISQPGRYISHCFGWTKERRSQETDRPDSIYTCVSISRYKRNAERHQGRRGTSIVNETRQLGSLCRRF